jgi:alpha-tubulin suppressor-like RCC1 family protein
MRSRCWELNATHRPLEFGGFGEKEVTKVTSGGSCSFAVTKSGKLYCWGFGENGQLATGQDQDDVITPTLAGGKHLEDGARVLQVSAGGQHTVILAAGVV